MRITLPVAIAALTVGLIALVAFLAVLGAAYSAPASPSPSPSPSVSPADPASPDLVAWATGWKDRAQRARKALSRVRSCFGDSPPAEIAKSPLRSAGQESWRKAGKRWRHQARDWRAKGAAGIARMRNPGGSGAARWWPAARYCGWPEHLKGWFCYIVWRESSARAHAVNPSSGCYGLLQLHPCHWGSKGLAWISDVLNQLRLGWHLYQECGASPWAL